MRYAKIQISVIIPTKDRIKQLRLCLASLISQESKPDEILIIDNSSKHSARQVASDFKKWTKIPIRYHHLKKQGSSIARNEGIRIAKYELLAFIDDDCTAHPRWLRQLAVMFSQYDGCIIVKGHNLNGLPDNLFSTVEYVNDELFFQTHLIKHDRVIYSQWIDSKNFAIRKSFLQKTNIRFRSEFMAYDDIAFSIELQRARSYFHYANDALVYHRGRNNALAHFLRDIAIGEDMAHLERFLKGSRNGVFISPLAKRYFTSFKKVSLDSDVKRRLFSYAIHRKGVLFSLLFYTLFNISITTITISYRVNKLFSHQ